MASRVGDERLADLASRHLADAWSSLAAFRGGEVHRWVNTTAYGTGHPTYASNGAVIWGASTPNGLNACLGWLEDRAQRYLLTIDDRYAAPISVALADRGMVIEDDPVPGMVIESNHPLPRPPTNIQVEMVDDSNYDAWVEITGAMYMGAPGARDLFSPTIQARPEFTALVGRLDGRYVSSAYLIRTGETAGIYAVGTMPQDRRKGVGGAVTAAAVEHARDQWGTRFVFLQSSEMAVPVYSALGFSTVVGLRMFGVDTAER